MQVDFLQPKVMLLLCFHCFGFASLFLFSVLFLKVPFFFYLVVSWSLKLSAIFKAKMNDFNQQWNQKSVANQQGVRWKWFHWYNCNLQLSRKTLVLKKWKKHTKQILTIKITPNHFKQQLFFSDNLFTKKTLPKTLFFFFFF